jgi:NAD(P)-dependent dehydrogenase (short-subunit alcohol dehydrogenase family)
MSAPPDNGRPVALITGAASGIGRALAIALAPKMTVFVADRQRALAEQVVSQIRTGSGSAYAVDLDVRNRAQFGQVVDSIVEASGRLDYLFNNAGIGVLGQTDYFTDQDWSDVLSVNLSGVCHGIAAAYPHMVRQRRGHIVNTASLAGLIPAPLIASYTASKFAIVGLSRALRIEAARHDVRVSVICPFIVDTPLLTGGRYGHINADVQSVTRARPLLHALAVTPERLAAGVLPQVARNRAVIVYPGWARLAWHLERLSPWIAERVTSRLMRHFMK